MSSSSTGSPGGQFVRFLGVGGANSLVTGATFLVLSYFLPQSLAYTLAFALGIVFSVVVTPRMVFRRHSSLARRAAFGGWYLIVYLIGLGAVYLLREQLRLERWGVVLATAAVTAGLGYLGGRHLFAMADGTSTKTGG